VIRDPRWGSGIRGRSAREAPGARGAQLPTSPSDRAPPAQVATRASSPVALHAGLCQHPLAARSRGVPGGRWRDRGGSDRTLTRRGHSSFVAAIAAGIFLASPARGGEVLRASGTGTALGAMQRLAEAFARASPGDRLDLLPSLGSSGSLKAVAQGAIDLAFAGRPPEPREKSLGIVAMAYAHTPLVFVSGPRAGVSAITARDAARIYRGTLIRWPNGERVRLVLRPRTDVDTQLIRAISKEMAEAMDVALVREGMLVAATNQDANAMVARTPGAFGPSSLTQILAEGSKLVPLAWEGVAPTLPNLASGAYPLVKTLHVAFRSPPRPAIRRFLAFLRAPEARRILEETGALPVALPPLE
jgi:phosphate transport system substrate-binding protein